MSADPGTPLLKNNRERLSMTRLLVLIQESLFLRRRNRTYEYSKYPGMRRFLPRELFEDILSGNHVNTTIIPNNISPTSKMYKKALNFNKSTDIFWKNTGPLTINYIPTLSSTKLNNVDVLLTDINTSYMLGWVSNNKIPVNAHINLEKYCICTWIDESDGTLQNKEKYMPNQNVELIRYVFALDENSNLIKKKEYIYNRAQKTDILRLCSRNNNNLLVDDQNALYYTNIAVSERIPCKINGVSFT